MRLSLPQIDRARANRIAATVLAFLGSLGFIIPNLARGAWLSDETYYMIQGQNYVNFLVRPTSGDFTRFILAYLNTPAQEATGLANHPFFGKLVIGFFTLLSGSSVLSGYCSGLPYFYLCSLLMPTANQLFWARLPSTVIAASTTSIVFYLVASRFGLLSATLAGVFLLSDATFLQYARLAMLDMYAATFLTASIAVALSFTMRGKALYLLGILSGLMLASKFALGVVIAFLFVLVIVLSQGAWKAVVVCVVLGLGVFFLVDFYYLLVSPSYLLSGLLAVSRPIPANIGMPQGPLAAFLATYAWQAYYSIPHVWSLPETALVVISLALASVLRIKRKNDRTGIDILFFASATLGLATFTWERPLVLLAPISAMFVSTTVAQFSREYIPKRGRAIILAGAIGASLTQLVLIAPQACYSHALFQYDASTYIPAILGFPTPRDAGTVVLCFLALFAASTILPLLCREEFGLAKSKSGYSSRPRVNQVETGGYLPA